MKRGYAGGLARVNLATYRVYREELNEQHLRKYIGGRGLASKILFEETKSGINPLGSENKLLFLTGPLTGTAIPGNSRYVVAAKSPLTGIWGEANAGGSWAAELKRAGYDGIVLEGVARRPLYLWIHDGEVEMRDASHLWGKTTLETEQAIKKELGDGKIRIVSIGPAGENGVMFASIISELGHAAGRTGLGAVMGSKRLKAIAVRGTRKIGVHNEVACRELARKLNEKIKAYPGWLSWLAKYGTNDASALSRMGALPTQNFRHSMFEGVDKISGETMAKTMVVKHRTCFACPLACNKVIEVKEGRYQGVSGIGPEYETVAAFGSLLLNRNLASIAKANQLCNLWGLDTMSTGAVIAFAMECWEEGIITKKDTEGIEFTWGNHEAMIDAIEKIARREGFGGILAKGVREASRTIGKGSEEFAMHVKGLEVPYHEPRVKKGVGLSYATSNRGACHLQADHDPVFTQENLYPEIGITKPMGMYVLEDKAELVKKSQDLRCATIFSLPNCLYTSMAFTISDFVAVANAVTGWDIDVAELMQTGERIHNLIRMYNVREGITSKDDSLPERFEQPLSQGPAQGQAVTERDLRSAVNAYYHCRGWDQTTGIPTREKLMQLGLQGAI